MSRLSLFNNTKTTRRISQLCEVDFLDVIVIDVTLFKIVSLSNLHNGTSNVTIKLLIPEFIGDRIRHIGCDFKAVFTAMQSICSH